MRTISQIVFTLCLAHSAIAAECLPYEPDNSTIVGTVVRKVFPGRPSFESIADGDEKLVYWILKLDRPVCVGSPGLATEVNEPESEVREIQLAPRDDKFYKHHRGVVGKRVKVTGTLFHQHSAWHVTKVVLQVGSLSHAQPIIPRDAAR
jgi:hypothetical protein